MLNRFMVFIVALLIGGAAVAVTVAADSDIAEAAVTNCSKGTGGDFGWSLCTGNNGNPPYTTQHVVQVKCTRAWYNGGGSYYATGNWANVGSYSTVDCAWQYSASSPIILFR